MKLLSAPPFYAGALLLCATSKLTYASNVPGTLESSSHRFLKAKVDKFTLASPLAVAAVCQDGVVIIAAHTASSHEPLLLQDDVSNGNDGSKANIFSDPLEKVEAHIRPSGPIDLPLGQRGPFRIESIDNVGTVLVTAGWRTDCAALVEKCRQVISDDAAVYSSTGTTGSEHGRFISSSASLWMSQCDFSENMRGLSCVGLLVFCDDVGRGHLWLVDATGAYPARAFAVGNGADSVNPRLARIDFSSYTKEESLVKILSVLQNETKIRRTGWNLPYNFRAEIALVDAKKRSMKKVRLNSSKKQ
uniref:Proteasome alpha-type subunits domain-containing protein n=1 Tax=Odontella aurita TaxID=265563 RepID=A0A7S4HLX4_9STRA|mmetsp:Transcript_1213/g.3247  ORF Transcript_1213/g.3247 Transcript_1213/m.3247 type:complete len:303 (+) Transcript_1213:99-1007(+)